MQLVSFVFSALDQETLIYEVFEREGGNLKRIGTADENLNILKK